jgi:hypothetical protein
MKTYTLKQLARRESLGWTTLQYFLDMGWVDQPKTEDAFTPAEADRAHINIRESIAYQRGWVAGMYGYSLTERVGITRLMFG